MDDTKPEGNDVKPETGDNAPINVKIKDSQGEVHFRVKMNTKFGSTPTTAPTDPTDPTAPAERPSDRAAGRPSESERRALPLIPACVRPSPLSASRAPPAEVFDAYSDKRSVDLTGWRFFIDGQRCASASG